MRGTETRLLIATAAGILALMILAWAALTWTPTPPASGNDAVARQIEEGAAVYGSRCATCHGEEGKAEICLDSDGEQIGCAGRVLHSSNFYCRFVLSDGQSMAQFVAGTLLSRGDTAEEIASHADFAELSEAEKRAVTAFIVNWHNVPEFIHCSPTVEPISEEDYLVGMVGDIDNGEQLYAVTYGCAACHGRLDDPDSAVVGPWVGEMSQPDYRPPFDGYTPADYLLESILDPNAYITAECPTGPCAGPPSVMPDNYPLRMPIQDVADVMAYILQSSEPLDLTED
ncbi:MAG: cytochrome c [Ardenticatenaceae bacterium]|nr:cytochrome c [Ardenticatenaceae bacterium]